MRFRTLEIRWHDSKPISTCDFQPISFKKARPPPGQERNYTTQSYRLATGGEDNHVRVWMVHPHMRPPNVWSDSDPNGPPVVARAPKVEYLATLGRHSAAVNVVRFSPNGELIASAGDDGMIIIWAPSNTPQVAAYGSDLTQDDLQHEKEYWKPRVTFRCTTMQVYDLAWSPTGEYIVAGSTDNTARVFAAADGKCIHEIAEHSHYVQGVAWDPLNEYIATQSSDRSMHIYRITSRPASSSSGAQGTFELHAVGKNTKMPHRHSRTPSTHSSSRPRMFRRESTASDLDSALVTDGEDALPSSSFRDVPTPLTPATSVGGTPSTNFMFPPPPVDASSRRSSFSGSNAPGSPSTAFSTPSLPAHNHSRYARSPSPMPPLPAIRTSPSSQHTAIARTAHWANVKLYGDESYTNFFRRLGFSPDGGLLLTPAGQFEDPSVNVGETTPSRGRKGHPAAESDGLGSSTGSSASSVYIYSRANFARPPIAQLPGHKKASVAVRFSPVLYELRQNVTGADGEQKPQTVSAVLEKGIDGQMDVDVVGPSASEQTQPALRTPNQLSTPIPGQISHPTPNGSSSTLEPPTPAASVPSTPGLSHATLGSEPKLTNQPTSIFALPYRMLFAVVTMDTVSIYDTQQASPVCILTKLHYDEFTDVTWSPDGQCLILSSRDGYCTLVIFDDILPAHHTQQQALQLQSIAHHHSVPLISGHASSHSMSHASQSSISSQMTPSATPLTSTIGLPSSSSILKKRTERSRDPPLTPAASVDGSDPFISTPAAPAAMDIESSTAPAVPQQEPPKKKRRVALTRVGDLD